MPSTIVQLAIIAAGALFGRWFLRAQEDANGSEPPAPAHRRIAVMCAVLLLAFVIAAPIVKQVWPQSVPAVFASFFESGALVFGGGHVVLPLLQAQVVPPGWITNAEFIAGYGAAQAVPGPLFSFAAYLGAAMHGPVHGAGGAALTLIAIYLPSFMLIAAVLPFWGSLRRSEGVRSALRGVNAAVVGILLAALYTPVWVNAIHSALDVSIALGAFLLLRVWVTPPWLVVLLAALASGILRA